MTDKGLERVESAQTNEENSGERLTRKQCKDLNIPYKGEEKENTSLFTLDDGDFEVIERDFYVNLDKVLSFGENEENEFTKVFMMDDLVLDVLETPRQINKKIKRYKRLN